MDEDDILIHFDRIAKRQNEAVRQLLLSEGRPDLCADLDKKLKEIRLGITGAQATWGALSATQRRVLLMMAEGRFLSKAKHSTDTFDAYGEPFGIHAVCRAPTVRNLMARELIGWESDRKITITEHGRFVLKHGQPPLQMIDDAR